MSKEPVSLHAGVHYLVNGSRFLAAGPESDPFLSGAGFTKERPPRPGHGTMAQKVLQSHVRSADADILHLVFDALVSPDNNYVSVLQTVRAAGIERYPLPYILTNCHNSYCAVSGTGNEDDHVFGLDCQKKYGGLFVPRYCAVLHQYVREAVAGTGKMVLGSDSHTRYGALGTLGFGEGGGEVAKQLLGGTYDLRVPEIIAVELTGRPAPGVGPHDISLALIRAVQPKNFVKNKILEFVGPGISSLSMDMRMGIDAMTTEAGGLSSIWCTDETVHAYLHRRGREDEFAFLSPDPFAVYNGLITLDLSLVEPMIALPFHPSAAFPVSQLNADPSPLFSVDAAGRELYGDSFSLSAKYKNGRLMFDQALISGCTGGLFENICAVRDILKGHVLSPVAPGLGINPASAQISAALSRKGIAADLLSSGVVMYPPGCGSCFGVTDIPACGQLSARHVTRNFANREGAQSSRGQHAAVALLDARSIAATVRNGGALTAATELDVSYSAVEESFDPDYYTARVYNGFGHPRPETAVRLGPGISNWPAFASLPEHLVLLVTGVYTEPVTTDDLIPSGEASSLRSNPVRLSEFLLSSRDPAFLDRAHRLQQMLRSGPLSPDLQDAVQKLVERTGCAAENVSVGGMLCALEIGEGSSREQAVSCQRILCGAANLAGEYPTKRYRTNCINWGILPLQCEPMPSLAPGDIFLLPHIAHAIREGKETVELILLHDGAEAVLSACLGKLTADERRILLTGCLINDFAHK